MGRRRSKWCYSTYIRYLNNGRGQGDLVSYLPWITIHDFPSKGKVVRMRGMKTGRIHHLMSQLEKTFFIMLDNDPDVEDIKEQFPLPLSQTQLIAASLHIKHPVVNGFPYVMTTDFFYKKDDAWHAVQIKPSKDLDDKRIREKFLIEKTYYDKIGIDWKVLTENDLSKVTADNYFWLSSGETVEKLIPSTSMRKLLSAAFLELYQDLSVPFHTIIGEIDCQCGLMPGTALQLFKSLALEGSICLDLTKRINTSEPRSLTFVPYA